MNSAFRAIWLVPLSRDIKYHSPPGGFRRKKMVREPHFVVKYSSYLGTAIKLVLYILKQLFASVSVNSGGYLPHWSGSVNIHRYSPPLRRIIVKYTYSGYLIGCGHQPLMCLLYQCCDVEFQNIFISIILHEQWLFAPCRVQDFLNINLTVVPCLFSCSIWPDLLPPRRSSQDKNKKQNRIGLRQDVPNRVYFAVQPTNQPGKHMGNLGPYRKL